MPAGNNVTTINDASDLLIAAGEYKGMGRWPLPIPLREKGPRIPKWTDLRLGDGDIEREFSGAPKNIGILLGEPSGWTIDIDLDCDEAIEVAEEVLPSTTEIFG